MLQISRMNLRSIAAVALALAAGAVAVILASQSTDATSAPIEPPASKFGVLEPASSAAMEAVPEETKMRLHFMASNPALSGGEVSEIGVVKRSNGSDITVAALGDAICAFMTEGIGGCDDGQTAASGQLFSAEPVGCEGYRVLGLVPNGVSNVAIDSQADGSVDATLPVTGNTYVGVLDPVQTVATGLGESGDAHFSVNLPLDSYASMNDACK